jgi:hypothetical protein
MLTLCSSSPRMTSSSVDPRERGVALVITE